MCREKTVVPKKYVKRVMQFLEDVNDPAEDLPSDANIEAAARGEIPLDGDLLRQQTRRALRRGQALNVALSAQDESENSVLSQQEYERIFEFMPRRSNRPVVAPPAHVQEMVREWYCEVQEVEDRSYELGDVDDRPYAPHIVAFFRKHLPEKLDINSWIGKNVVYERLKRELWGDADGLQPWRQGMESTASHTHLPYLGTGGEGRWVWTHDDLGVPVPEDDDDKEIHADISDLIATAEKNLVRLAIQIANWLASWLVEEYVHVQVHRQDRRTLSGPDIVRAVVEIFGDEWFELPFDDGRKLKKWKMRRSIFFEDGVSYHHVFIDAIE